MNKDQQTQLLNKFIREYHSKQRQQEPPAAATNRPVSSNYTSSNNPSDTGKLQEQLKKRQQAIEKLYRRSVVNKIYIFPREEERVEDLMSVSSHRSIDEMEEVTTYRLSQQVQLQTKKINKSYDRLLDQYRSQQPQQQNISASKHELGVREGMKNRRVESSGRLQWDADSKASKDSARVMAFGAATNTSMNNASGLSIKKEGKKAAPLQQQLSARQDANPPLSAKQPKSKKQTYQQLLQRLESKSKDSHKPAQPRGDFAKAKQQSNGKSKPTHQSIKRQPFSNVSVSKILDKYNQLKVRNVKREDRCRTQY